MYKLPDVECRKCGGGTSIHWVASSGMDIRPTGMFRTCHRCGFEESVSDLENKTNKLNANDLRASLSEHPNN